MPRPLGLPHADQPFADLAELRDLTRQILSSAQQSLSNYADDASGGFYHVLDADVPPAESGADDQLPLPGLSPPQTEESDESDGDVEPGNRPGDFSRASTATVVKFLAASGNWGESDGDRIRAQRLLDGVVKNVPWSSAGLDDDNPFTVAFLLELVADLVGLGAVMSEAQNSIVAGKLDRLVSHLDEGNGAIAIEYGLPNAFLTQLTTRALRQWDDLLAPVADGVRFYDEERRERTRLWAMSAVDTEISLARAAPRDLDVFELGYAILLVLAASPPEPSPLERRRLAAGLDILFGTQADDGTWPQSRRLFHYPSYGNAYCYEYEFLTQVLNEIADPLLLRPYLTNFRRGIDRLVAEYVHLPSGGYGWMSGHHRRLKWPESWSTASCLHFSHLLDRFVSDAIRDAIQHDLGARAEHPIVSSSFERFDRLLDSSIMYQGSPLSLKRVMQDHMIKPVLQEVNALNMGRGLPDGTAMSAILFGPPGTSKTTYVEAISAAIGWPLISIDPSHLLREGIVNLIPEVNRLFRMLEYADNVVVFFDEIDELVRDRFGDDEESTSRFLTTAMLPKIMLLRRSRRMLFFVATNHIEVFDSAIARPGRFDLIIPVLPPTLEEKLIKWSAVESKFGEFHLQLTDSYKATLRLLTFDEFSHLALRISSASSAQELENLVKDAGERCTMRDKVKGDQTWESLMDNESGKIRIPGSIG